MASESAKDHIIPECEAVEVCRLSVDLVVQSSNGKRIGAHMKNLKQFCTAFPLTDSVTHDIEDVIIFNEDAETLLLLLQYTHYDVHHNLKEHIRKSEHASTFVSLTAAADKYGNFFALEACKSALNHVGLEDHDDALRVLPSLLLIQDF
ncbi:hypothetical protein Moror_7872 [Moniliophthora roreri MCA 2997]|uniref:BTB domain-containing protein n=1 Tax=Moniliophthora roreri (strain MCA 2997) TaxID=1381753 RepID=V2XB83_MONRO|nr:hypothetical protein Moror_7872 [Moniliophthora roreri MCA 2997]